MLLHILTFLACSADKDINDDPDTSDSAADEESDSGLDDIEEEEDEGFVPTKFTISANFAYDATAGTLHNFRIDENEYNPQVQIMMYNDADVECKLVFNISSPETVAVENWSFEDPTDPDNPQQMMHMGFMVPGDADLLTSPECDDWDPTVYGSITDVVVPHSWGVSVGNIRLDIQELIETDANFSAWKEHLDAGELMGGSWSSDLWEPATYASHVALGAPLEDWVLQLDPETENITEFLQVSDLQGGLVDGFYQLRPVYLWDFDRFFGN